MLHDCVKHISMTDKDSEIEIGLCGLGIKPLSRSISDEISLYHASHQMSTQWKESIEMFMREASSIHP